jgi:hypothetical protein
VLHKDLKEQNRTEQNRTEQRRDKIRIEGEDDRIMMKGEMIVGTRDEEKRDVKRNENRNERINEEK